MKWGPLPPPVLAEDNRARSFWQSRAGLRDAPQLTDIEALARKVREAYRG